MRVEQATEFIGRIRNNGTLPLFTSCSPGWVNFIEQYEPEYLDHLSAVKSEQQIAGTLTKHHYAEQLGYNKEDVVFVTIMPCIAKKDEADRPQLSYDDITDVDYVLTVREYARLLKRKSIDLLRLEDGSPYGELYEKTERNTLYKSPSSTLEGTLHIVSEILDDKPHNLDFKGARGSKGIKEATYHVAGMDLSVALVQGGINMKDFFSRLRKTKKQYHFVEFESCKEGCTNGGGQPIHPAIIQDTVDISGIRKDALDNIEESKADLDDNLISLVKPIYTDFLGQPGSKEAIDMLHTTYQERSFYKQ